MSTKTDRTPDATSVQRSRKQNRAVQGQQIGERQAAIPAADALQRALAPTPRIAASDVVALQRTVGNRSTHRLILQARLQVGPAGDSYEQEADRVADQVMRMPAPPTRPPGLQRHTESEAAIQTKPLASTISRLVQRTTEEDEAVQTKPMTAALQRALAIQREGDEDETAVQTKSLAEGGFEAGSHVEQQIQASRGGGTPLPSETRSFMEGRFGADFGGVRIHTGASSVQMNRELGAKAFTHGQDIHFGAGQYNPGTDDGKHLLAHELTHTIQQSSSGLKRKRIQRAISTMGGDWKTNTYKPVMEDGSKPGAEIEIEFTPNKLVNAKKIGLFQKIEKVLNDTNLDAKLQSDKQAGTLFGNATKTAASRTTGRGHWDRALDQSNPVYGAPALNEGESVSKTPLGKFDMSASDPAKRQNYQLGYRYTSFFSTKQRPAKLWDKPNMPTVKQANASEMIFETSAMAIDGDQKNVSYGSIRWGWRKDAGDPVDINSIKLVPLSIVEMGTPSAEMQGLANVWNQAKTTTAKGEMQNTQIPTSGYSTGITEADASDPVKVQQGITRLEQALKAKNIAANDKANMKFELKFLKDKLKSLT